MKRAIQVIVSVLLLASGVQAGNAGELTYSKEQYALIIGQVAMLGLCRDADSLKRHKITHGDCYAQSEKNLPVCQQEVLGAATSFDGKLALYKERDRLNTVRFERCLLEKILIQQRNNK